MRIDKYLKVTRLIKRRTVAAESCDKGRVRINGKDAKPSSTVREGDVIEIGFGTKLVKARVLSVVEHVRAEEASSLYEIIGEN